MNGMKIGLFIGLAGGVFGIVVVIIFSPLIGSIFASIFAAIFGWVYLAFIKPLFDSQKIMKTGVEALATIINVWDTGVTINENPQIGIKLKVEPVSLPPYEVDTKQLVSRLQTYLYAPGTQVTVKYDPADLQKVVISGFPGNKTSVGNFLEPKIDPALLQKKLVDGETLRQKLLVAGLVADGTITGSQFLGINVNGNNPAMELTIDFETKDRSHRTSKLILVISPASMIKYQVGCKVSIRYEEMDPTQISVNQ